MNNFYYKIHSGSESWLKVTLHCQKEMHYVPAPRITHPTARTCSVLGENVKQKTCTSVDNDWYDEKSPATIFHITTWPFSSPLAIHCCPPATDQCTVVNLCCKHQSKLSQLVWTKTYLYTDCIIIILVAIPMSMSMSIVRCLTWLK